MGFFTFAKKDKVRRSSSSPPPPKAPSRRSKTYPQPQPSAQLPASLFEPPNVYVECDSGRDKRDEKRARHKPSRGAVAAPPDQERRRRDRDSHRRRQQPQEKQHGVLAYHQRNASTPQLTSSFRPAGYLTSGSAAAAAAATVEQPSNDHQQHRGCGAVVVNNHYYLNNPPPLPQRHQERPSRQLQQNPYPNQVKFSKSVAHLAHDATAVPHAADGLSLSAWYNYSTNLVTSTVHVCDDISNRLNNVLTAIDGETMHGHELDLYNCRTPPKPQYEAPPLRLTEKEHGSGKSSSRKSSKDKDRDKTREKERSRDGDRDRDKDKEIKHNGNEAAATVVRGDYFAKVELYANSKLPKGLPPMSVYYPTWPLLCLAAQHSLSVYEKPTGEAREAHVSGDWRSGTKAMCIKSVPMDAMNTIVFAIRGTATFMDWAVNLNHAPTAPTNFLDDTGNLCHAGFLTVARRMVEPVAARLRQLLEDDPSRSRYSLLITGHSAGGAVASLLYSHMLAESKEAESELNLLTSSFKRVHCVTFGTPPLSLLPLTKPDRPELKNSVFLSFINQGDPVVRADKAYIKSLLELLGSPPPDTRSSKTREPRERRRNSSPSRKSRHRSSSHSRTRSKPSKPTWSVPPNTLSLAGRLIVMRSGRNEGVERPRGNMPVEDRLDAGVEAFVCQDDDLRGLVWGDPVAHMMKLYAKRVETLAVDTITMKR